MGKLKSSPRRPLASASKSIEELARLQGVRPAFDLDEIGSHLPAGDKTGGLLDFIINERRKRRERRRVGASKGKKK